MVVLHVISGGEKGGSKKHLLSLVNEMKKKNLRNIIACFIEGELYREAKEMGLEVFLIKQEKRFDLSVVNKLSDLCKNEKVNIVNSHGGRANFICSFLRKKISAKFITTIHSDYESDYKGNKYKTFVYSKINKLALKKFDYYIAVSKNFKNLLINRGFNENKIFTVYNGIDTKKHISNLSKDDVIKKYKLPIFNNYISMIGRFHPIKGHKDFLDACETIHKDLKDTGIILVGDGETKSDIENYIKSYKIENNIIFVGFKAPDDFINISDFTVLTSYSETFPLVILESGLYSRPVIASNVGGISEIIKDMETGLLIFPGNIKEIGEKINILNYNKELTYNLGLNLNKLVNNKFSLKALADSYEKIWNKILEE